MDTLTVETLAAILQEPQVPLLRQVLRTLGQDRCAAILADTLACEARGGMPTQDGTRRRTPGGGLCQLVLCEPGSGPCLAYQISAPHRSSLCNGTRTRKGARRR